MAHKERTDIPSTPDTSSVGFTGWPPQEASEQRKKAIYPDVIENAEDLSIILRELHAMPFDAKTTRYSIRAFISRNAFAQAIQTDPLLYEYTEGAIDLAGIERPELEDTVIAYFGKNNGARRTAPDLYTERIARVRDVYQSERYAPREPRFEIPGFTIDQLAPKDTIEPAIIDQYAHLYKAFGRSREDVEEMLVSPTNIHVAAFYDTVPSLQDIEAGANPKAISRELVSAGIGELSQVTIRRNGIPYSIRFAEVTEAATREDFRGSGLYTIVANNLNRILASHNLDFVMAESNASAPGVIMAARLQGRSTSLEVLDQFGLPERLLEQHVRIFEGSKDMRPETEKNDLVPTFMTRQTLQKRYGKTTQ
jgi:hypothetical protein